MEIELLTNIEAFKKHLDKMVIAAQMQLKSHGAIQQYFVTNNGFDFEEAPLELSPEMKDIEEMQVKAVCTNPSITSSALVLDVHTMTVLTEDVSKYEGVNLENHPQATNALLVILYTPNESYVRTMPYRKKASGEYWFGDRGWEEAPEVLGAFKNPHKI